MKYFAKNLCQITDCKTALRHGSIVELPFKGHFVRSKTATGHNKFYL